MVQTNLNSCCTPDKPCINHRDLRVSRDVAPDTRPGGRVVLMDPSRMPAENPLYRRGEGSLFFTSSRASSSLGGHPTPRDVANAGFKSAEKMLAGVDMGALQDAADRARTEEDDDFAALVREKRDAGRLAKGAKFLVAKFALQSDPRFKAVKTRADELYNSILQREKTMAGVGEGGGGGGGNGGGGGGGAAGGAGFVPAHAGRRRAMPPPPVRQIQHQHQQRQLYDHLQPCGYVMDAGADAAPLGGPPQLVMMQQQQQRQQQMMMTHPQQRMMHQQTPSVGYGYGHGPRPPQPPQALQLLRPLQPPQPPQPLQPLQPQLSQPSQPLQHGPPWGAPAPPAPEPVPVPPPAPPPAPPSAPAPPRDREDPVASPKRTRVDGDEDSADYRERDRN